MKTVLKIVLLILGALALYSSGKMLYDQYQFKQNAVQTKATVISYRTTESTSTEKKGNKKVKETTTFYYPTFEFKDHLNRTIQVESKLGEGNSEPYPIGNQVDVIYSKENPQKAQIEGFATEWMMPIIMGVFGLILFLVGVFLPKR